MAHAGGRPTDYDPTLPDRLPDMFREGQSIVEIAAELDVSRDTLYEWAKVHKEFSDALTRGRDLSQAWWEKQGRLNLMDTEEYDGETKMSTKKRINDRLWSKNVSCRFRKDWTEKTEISGPDGGPLSFAVAFLKTDDAPNNSDK